MSFPVCAFQNIVCLFLVNDFSGSKISNFEAVWIDLESDYSSSSDAATVILILIKKDMLIY